MKIYCCGKNKVIIGQTTELLLAAERLFRNFKDRHAMRQDRFTPSIYFLCFRKGLFTLEFVSLFLGTLFLVLIQTRYLSPVSPIFHIVSSVSS